MRRSFIGEIHVVASNWATRAASVERQPAATNDGSVPMPVAPFNNASRKRSSESPNGETTPRPVIETGSATARTLPFRIVRVQSSAMRTFTTAIAAMLSSVALWSSSTLEPDLFDELYARGQKLNAGLSTLTASFTETSTSPLLTKPIVASGTVIVERPGRVALRYVEPDERTVIIDGDRMTISWPSAKILSTKDISVTQRRIQKYFVDSSPRELRSHFDVTAREAQDRPGTYLVTMVPKRKQIQEGITRLELWIDRSTLLLSAMRMTFPGGDTKLMTFADVKRNVPVDPSMFTVR